MRLFITKPFKGNWYYEMQVGPFVLQFLHDLDHEPYRSGNAMFTLGRFQIWRDSMWRDHMLLLPRWVRRTFVGDLVCDWKRQNRPRYR